MSAVSPSVQKSSLTDIIQSNAIGANTCRIQATTPFGRGVIFIADGEVVDAGYGSLSGEDAFHALINADVTQTYVSTGLRTPNRRIHSGWQALIARAMTLRFDGGLPVPSFPDDRRETESATAPTREPAPAGRPEQGTVETAKKPPAARPEALPVEAGRTDPAVRRAVVPNPPSPVSRRSRAVPITVGAVLALVVVAGDWQLRSRPRAGAAMVAGGAPAASTKVRPSSPPIEATELKGTDDAVPALLSGVAPRSPNAESALVPTIVCRLLVAEDGSVKEASIFQSRLDQASFETAALASVKTYRFTPGRRGGRPVAVWINWPVSFQ